MPEHPFKWRSIIITAFGPSVLFWFTNGAIFAIIALSAIELGASSAISGLIVALIGIGSLLNNIPAAFFINRIGERRAMISAAALSALALIICFITSSVWLLAAGVFMQGMSQSVFDLARQTYLIDVVPSSHRARAFSILGGSQRIGFFIGPFVAAAAISLYGIKAAYFVGFIASCVTAVFCTYIPELHKQKHVVAKASNNVFEIAKRNFRVLITIGFGVLIIGALRASRQIALPLWADNIGISASATALIFGVSSAMEILIFYPAGKVMDSYGRKWVAIPCVLMLGSSMLFMPLSHTLIGFTAIAVIMGLGNGMGSGIVMTLGADAAPVSGRIQFLGLWRIISGTGTSLGPALIALFTAMFSLGMGITAIGASGFVAALVFMRYLQPAAKH